MSCAFLVSTLNVLQVDIADWKLAFPHHWKSALNSLVLEKLVREIDENIIVLNSKVFEEGKNYEGFGSVGKGGNFQYIDSALFKKYYMVKLTLRYYKFPFSNVSFVSDGYGEHYIEVEPSPRTAY